MLAILFLIMCTNPFLSMTKKDFTDQGAKPIVKNFIPQEFKDPITESFKSYLTAKDEATGEEEVVDAYTSKFLEENETIGNIYFGSRLLDRDVVLNEAVDDKRTVYDIDYCDKELFKKYLEEEAEKQRFRLPDDWYIPLTTQKISYREPLMMSSDAYKRSEKKTGSTSLGTDSKIREILQVTTGITEYQSIIGHMGEIIIKEGLHRKPS
ncbi:uncharacterized protein LOC108738393 [Agrilus planipennis]|uniref:Uncharacterized protein LOC108738393 n=1 Tax=Agrilus planipennis TaxID=224129 RepID=A0A1W4X4P0_AGRPL|nr:uncharacterized protein LOC108738393 [Agrilus planipennis]